MAEEALHLLQRIAEQLSIALHRASRGRRVAQAMLDQHGEHVDSEGVTELVRADVNGQPGRVTALAGASEDRLPGVGLDGLPDLGRPENRRLLRRAIVVADDEAATLVGSE